MIKSQTQSLPLTLKYLISRGIVQFVNIIKSTIFFYLKFYPMRYLFGILVLVLAFGLDGSGFGQILVQSFRTEHNIEVGGETI